MYNKSGNARLRPSDNRVIKAGAPTIYEGQRISYDSVQEGWLLNDKTVGSRSNLSKALKLNVETHDVGFVLEKMGYVFAKPFN